MPQSCYPDVFNIYLLLTVSEASSDIYGNPAKRSNQLIVSGLCLHMQEVYILINATSKEIQPKEYSLMKLSA